MIRFFRRIRKSLLIENRLGKYLLYAFGEIILVMIGILLALQINSWNDKRIKAGKEINYLRDIRSNLEDDLKGIDYVLEFNKEKAVLSDSMYYTLNRYSDPESYMPIIIRYMFTLTMYEYFEPNRIAFTNMLAAENIDLIKDEHLKLRLSQYYKREFNNATQESVKQRARQFGDYVGVTSFNKQTVKSLINHDSQLRDISEVNLHTDPKVYAYLFVMMTSTESQSEILLQFRKETEQLNRLINKQIE